MGGRRGRTRGGRARRGRSRGGRARRGRSRDRESQQREEQRGGSGACEEQIRTYHQGNNTTMLSTQTGIHLSLPWTYMQ